MKHIVCFSGGHSSGIVAIEVARRFGAENTILLNHDISSRVELPDVKRFKQQIADYLCIPITYANHEHYETATPITVCVQAKTWVNPNNRTILCTHRLKTDPFYKWLRENYQSGDVCYYGMDSHETARITRRSAAMGADGFAVDFPLATWRERTISKTMQVGIAPPVAIRRFQPRKLHGMPQSGMAALVCNLLPAALALA
jgi:3'-phosphoadenosine 5'-phosphosulfate sulfotransferase (PAPS reductase)/FAD synthetase